MLTELNQLLTSIGGMVVEFGCRRSISLGGLWTLDTEDDFLWE